MNLKWHNTEEWDSLWQLHRWRPQLFALPVLPDSSPLFSIAPQTLSSADLQDGKHLLFSRTGASSETLIFFVWPCGWSMLTWSMISRFWSTMGAMSTMCNLRMGKLSSFLNRLENSSSKNLNVKCIGSSYRRRPSISDKANITKTKFAEFENCLLCPPSAWCRLLSTIVALLQFRNPAKRCCLVFKLIVSSKSVVFRGLWS